MWIWVTILAFQARKRLLDALREPRRAPRELDGLRLVEGYSRAGHRPHADDGPGATPEVRKKRDRKRVAGDPLAHAGVRQDQRGAHERDLALEVGVSAARVQRNPDLSGGHDGQDGDQVVDRVGRSDADHAREGWIKRRDGARAVQDRSGQLVECEGATWPDDRRAIREAMGGTPEVLDGIHG